MPLIYRRSFRMENSVRFPPPKDMELLRKVAVVEHHCSLQR
jgi:hypothetical protein